MPTFVVVSINRDTGNLLEFAHYVSEYRGPLEPEITEEDAIETTRQIAESQFPTGEFREVEHFELRAIVVPANSRPLGGPPEDLHQLVWQVTLEGTATTQIDAITGEPVR